MWVFHCVCLRVSVCEQSLQTMLQEGLRPDERLVLGVMGDLARDGRYRVG
jgi:hypothetical protein